MQAAVGPTTQPERITSLDVLRGFAVLGILVMNVQSFSMPVSAYMNPTAYGNLEGANYWVWFVSHVLFDQKFMTIFSMLFGAGIILLTTRVEARGDRPARVHYRRMLWLLLFGLLHAYLLWYGDILVLYAICGLLAYLFRTRSPRTLLIVGVLVIAVASAFDLFLGLTMPYWPEEQVTALKDEDWAPPPDRIEWELATYRGGWMQQMEHRVPMSFFLQTFLTLIEGLWRAGGLMLVGMAFFKWGIFSAERSTKFYAGLVAAGALVGIPVIVYGVRLNEAAHWDVRYSMFLGGEFNYWGSLLACLMWVALVMLVCKHGLMGWLRRALGAVGQMAFTNYLMQTLICTMIFYGHGLGLFGEVTRVGQVAVVATVWILQLACSPLWLRYFRFGPLEWLWRALTYGRAPALLVTK